MPVVTRNQSKNIGKTCIQEVNPVSHHLIKKVRYDPNNITHWFNCVVEEGIRDVKRYNAEKARLNILIEANPHHIKNKIYKNEFIKEHINAIRRLTEVMYVVEQYYPQVRNQSPMGMDRFGLAVYNKVQDFYNQIRGLNKKPVTEDEKKCIAAFIYTIQDVEKMLIPYLNSSKRFRKFVDYTGMDTIELELFS